MRLSSFQDLLCWCHFPKWVFAEGRSTRSQWCLEEVQGPIWCQRIIWWWRAFPRMPKTMNFNHPTIWWDRKLETLGLFRRRISSRSVLSCQNLLNRHMGQTETNTENHAFQIFHQEVTKRSPIGRTWELVTELIGGCTSKNIGCFV